MGMYCKVCGRSDRKIIKGMCPRHKSQFEEFGYNLDDNPIDEYDMNEIVLHKDYAEIKLYDNLFNELEDSIMIDLEDISTVEGIIWKKVGKHIVGNANQYSYDLPNLIMDTSNKIEYLDGDIFNNRKSNLDVIEKKRFKHHFSSNKKHKNKIIITSLGGSTEDVTGSCFAIEYPMDNGNRDLVLIECGSVQTNRIVEDYNANKKMVDNIPFNLASNIFINHQHQDHIGNCPAAITRGFNGNIITTYENSEIMKPMLIDAAFIHNRNISALNNKGKKYEALYDESDVYSILSKIKVYSSGEIHKINSNLSFRFTNNNHCFGSKQLELFIKKPSGRIVKLFYSSDLGSKLNQKYKPYSDERVDVSKANVAIFESTYGDSNRCFTKKDVDKETNELINKIKEVTYRGNRVLIPAFSYDRAQSVMNLIYNQFKDDPKFKDVKVIVDSRLLNEINSVYLNVLCGDKKEEFREMMDWKNFIFVTEYKRTEILAKETGCPCVIISSSGMLCAGHALTYAKSILPRKKDCLMFVGYCSPLVIGGKIQQGAKSVTIDNQSIPIRCEVVNFKTFTGHIQCDELISYMKNINCSNVYIHHGSDDAKKSLKFKADENFLFNGVSKKVKIIDKKNNQIIL